MRSGALFKNQKSVVKTAAQTRNVVTDLISCICCTASILFLGVLSSLFLIVKFKSVTLATA